MKYIERFVKKINVLECLIILLFVYSSLQLLCHYDNDIWFIMASGRHILSNGISHFDFLSMHSDYVLVMQQWLTSTFYYSVYHFLGNSAFTTLLLFISLLSIFLLLRLSFYVTKNKNISAILVMFYIYFFSAEFYTSRPQIITYVILIASLLLCEKYYRTDNKKYLYLLPVLSLLEINFHASMWFLLICFIGTYLVNAITNKDKFIKLFITIICMVLIAFINPYGLDALTYVLNSYGDSVLNLYVNEMVPLTYNYKYFIGIFVSILLLIPLNGVSKNKLQVRHILLLAGCLYLSFSNLKSAPYAGMAIVVSFSHLLEGESISNSIKNILKIFKIKVKEFKVNETITSLLKVCVLVISIFTLIGSLLVSFKVDDFRHPLEDLVDVLDKETNKEDIVLYADYSSGGYLEWRGYKPYIDARGDVFLKKTNKKYDLVHEIYGVLTAESNYVVEAFLDKYEFDYMIISTQSRFNRYFNDTKDKRYEKIYTSKNINYDLYRKVDTK